MNRYTVCCGYASHYHNTVTVEADTLGEALEKAIEQAGDDPHWKSVDQASQTFVDAVAEGMDADPWGDTAIPVPDRFTENGEPPVVTLTGLRARPAASRSRAAPSAFVSLKTPARSRRRPPIRRPRRATSLWSRSDAEPMALRTCPSAAAVHARQPRTAGGRLIADGIRPSQTACLAPLRAGAGFRPCSDGRGAGASR